MPRFPFISNASSGLSDRVFGALATLARSRRGVVYPLHVGDTWLDPHPAGCAEAQTLEEFESDPSARFSRLHGYAAPHGEPAMIAAVMEHVERISGVQLAPHDLQVVSGATAGISAIVEALMEPGEEMIIPAPFWPLVRGTTKRRGAIPIEVPFFDRLSSAAFDPESALEANISERTVAIYVNSPHNPTGVILDEAVIAAIERVALRHDLWVIADEVYEELYFTPVPPPSVWNRPLLRERALVVHSLSKAYGLAGARVGFVHGPGEAIEALRAVQTFTTYCAPRPMQRGAARVLREGQGWIANARGLYREAALRTAEALGIEPPAGGTFAFFDLKPFLREGETAQGLLERCVEAGILLTPGSASGRDYGNFARLCFTSVRPSDLDAALAILKRVFNR